MKKTPFAPRIMNPDSVVPAAPLSPMALELLWMMFSPQSKGTSIPNPYLEAALEIRAFVQAEAAKLQPVQTPGRAELDHVTTKKTS